MTRIPISIILEIGLIINYEVTLDSRGF